TEVREYPAGQTVLLEAMALGKACVVTDTPGIREYVSDGVDAVLVPPRDPEALRSAVSALLADGTRRRELGAAARRTSDSSGGAADMWEAVARVVEGLGCA
ncbi:MAG: glycosyltransferase, partial [Dehalococcoidia bacterium]|nr:glycosyltransferase [Dehalococcoidia bacterium]